MKNVNLYGLYKDGKLLREVKLPKATADARRKKLKAGEEIVFHSPLATGESKVTHNNLVQAILNRVEELANLSMDELRSWYPAATDTRNELIRFCKDSGFNRGQLISHIVYEEFDVEFDYDLTDLEESGLKGEQLSLALIKEGPQPQVTKVN